MPTQNIIPVTPGSGLDLDAVSLVIGGNTVFREVLVIADPSNATQLATVTAGGALNVSEATLDACITANVLAVSLPAGQITTLTPPTAAAIGTAVSTDLLIGTQLAAASVPVALPTATITTLTPPTAAAIAAAIVANPPTVPISGNVGVTQSTSPWVVSLASTTITGTVAVTQSTSPWIVAGGGTAGTAATGVVTVQGIAAMTPLLVTATFASSQHVIVDSGTITAVTAITNALPAGTNVIGHVIVDSGTITTVSTVTAVTAITNALPAGSNVIGHVIADSGSTTAVTGNVTVTQGTGANLHAVIDTGSTTAVTQATAANLNAQVQGTAAEGAAASGNPVRIGGVDDFGKIRNVPVSIVGATAAPTVLLVGGRAGVDATSVLFNTDTAGNQGIAIPSLSLADGVSTASGLENVGTGTGLILQVAPSVFNGTSWDRLRTPNKFFTASVAATATGNTAVWTPTSGKKFRLMRFQVTAQGLAATATGVVTVTFQDATTQINTGAYDVDVPAIANVTSGTDNISGGWIDLGNGYLSAAANNVLNFNISAAGAGTVGTYRINVAGTEE